LQLKKNINFSDLGIITKPRPGDQFVSIDGKKTYFEIGPTALPTPGAGIPPPPPRPAVAASKPLPGRGEVIGATLQIGGIVSRVYLRKCEISRCPSFDDVFLLFEKILSKSQNFFSFVIFHKQF
jgi:hypothetical protein